ncbi:MAG: DUF2975 domain-containing protein [Caulobacterales bacterium]
MRALGPGSVSSFLKVILDVFYYVLWVAGVLFAVVILALLLVSFNPQLLPAPVYAQITSLGHSSAPGAAALLTGYELYLIGVIIIVQRLRKIFATMTAGDPFHPDNVRRLRMIGLVLALLEIDRYLASGFERFVLHMKPHPGESDSLTAWFAVLVIFVLAEVFREGARLRRDAELTI